MTGKSERNKAIEAGWDKDLIQIGEELQVELVRSIENSCKKIMNLKLVGYDARSLVSLALCGAWSHWLCALSSDERVKFFETGTKLVADDLMRKIQDEINGTNSNQ